MDEKEVSELNKRAQDSYERIKGKFLGRTLRTDNESSSIKEKRQEWNNTLQKVISETELRSNVQEEIKEEVQNINFAKEMFSYIDSLNLPPNLSKAIALIIASSKSQKEANLYEARKAIADEMKIEGEIIKS